MSPLEIIYRGINLSFNYLNFSFPSFFQSIPKYNLEKAQVQFWFQPKNDVENKLYKTAADKLIMGIFNIFELDRINIGFPPPWNTDPKTNNEAPLIFSKTLNYQDKDLVGDIKYLWEINRHLDLVTIAQAWYLSEDEKYLDAIDKYINSWIDSCPYLLGPNWASGLEVAIRLINWSLTWQLIGGLNSRLFASENGEKTLNKWINSIYQHVQFINNNLSKYSSANNHLIGELTGLYIGTTTWPYFKKFKNINKKSKNQLINEAHNQTYSDGVNKEQSINYQKFVLEFLIISGIAGENTENEFPSQYWSLVEKMLGYLDSSIDKNGNYPMFGDSDDGLVFKLHPDQKGIDIWPLFALGAKLFQYNHYPHRKNVSHDYIQWFLSDSCINSHRKYQSNKSKISRVFYDGGYYILGEKFGSTKEVKCIVDAGPLGYLSLAAHGHADALSIYLSINGHELLIDPGTYTYYSSEKWRRYFRGTSAHNTVRVDKTNQSTIIGTFMWSHKAKTQVEELKFSKRKDLFIGSHDGYMNLPDPVIHRRKIEVEKNHQIIKITDSLDCENKHFIEVFWHLSEKCQVEFEDYQNVNINLKDMKFMLSIKNSDFKFSKYYGQDDPPLGWVSRSFGTKQPTTTLVASGTIIGSTTLRFALAI
ncbi:MAG: alginate lyase family protein [Candidatus Helarchaeota archaeon]